MYQRMYLYQEQVCIVYIDVILVVIVVDYTLVLVATDICGIQWPWAIGSQVQLWACTRGYRVERAFYVGTPPI